MDSLCKLQAHISLLYPTSPPLLSFLLISLSLFLLLPWVMATQTLQPLQNTNTLLMPSHSDSHERWQDNNMGRRWSWRQIQTLIVSLGQMAKKNQHAWAYVHGILTIISWILFGVLYCSELLFMLLKFSWICESLFGRSQTIKTVFTDDQFNEISPPSLVPLLFYRYNLSDSLKCQRASSYFRQQKALSWKCRYAHHLSNALINQQRA